MMTRAIRFVAAASLAAVPPLAAQSAGTVEIGAFARYTDFDNSLAMNNAVGVGGQVTVYLEHVVAVELDVSRTSAGRPAGGWGCATARVIACGCAAGSTRTSWCTRGARRETRSRSTAATGVSSSAPRCGSKAGAAARDRKERRS